MIFKFLLFLCLLMPFAGFTSVRKLIGVKCDNQYNFLSFHEGNILQNKPVNIPEVRDDLLLGTIDLINTYFKNSPNLSIQYQEIADQIHKKMSFHSEDELAEIQSDELIFSEDKNCFFLNAGQISIENQQVLDVKLNRSFWNASSVQMRPFLLLYLSLSAYTFADSPIEFRRYFYTLVTDHNDLEFEESVKLAKFAKIRSFEHEGMQLDLSRPIFFSHNYKGFFNSYLLSTKIPGMSSNCKISDKTEVMFSNYYIFEIKTSDDCLVNFNDTLFPLKKETSLRFESKGVYNIVLNRGERFLFNEYIIKANETNEAWQMTKVRIKNNQLASLENPIIFDTKKNKIIFPLPPSPLNGPSFCHNKILKDDSFQSVCSIIKIEPSDILILKAWQLSQFH